jgi:hypothetical protein
MENQDMSILLSLLLPIAIICTSKKQDSHPPFSRAVDDTCMGEGKDQKPEIIMHIMPLKVGLMIWTNL